MRRIASVIKRRIIYQPLRGRRAAPASRLSREATSYQRDQPRSRLRGLRPPVPTGKPCFLEIPAASSAANFVPSWSEVRSVRAPCAVTISSVSCPHLRAARSLISHACRSASVSVPGEHTSRSHAPCRECPSPHPPHKQRRSRGTSRRSGRGWLQPSVRDR